MAEAHEAVREFVMQVEKALITRNLYAPHMAPYQEAAERLVEKCRQAVGEAGFELTVGPMELLLGRVSILKRPKREDSFFFPLYRDGLRELSFAPGVTPEELERLLTVFEAEPKRQLGAADDTMTFLWRCDLSAITYKAIDGIGDQEGDESSLEGGDDYGALVADLASKIRQPAAPVTGQSYSFVLDADVKVAATDMHYEATTARRGFEENPTVLQLSPEEVAAIRGEIEGERDQALLARFVDILFVMLADPSGAVPAVTVAPILSRLLTGFWDASDFEAAFALLGRLSAAAEGAALPEHRAAARGVVEEFLTAERVAAATRLMRDGAFPLEAAARLWDLAGDGCFRVVLESWAGLPEGALRTTHFNYLRGKVAAQPDLLRAPLRAAAIAPVRAALALLDDRLATSYAPELLGLAEHQDEAIRLKGIAAAGKLGGPAALEVIWKAMDGDPSRSVRLLAFRLMATSALPGLAARLRSLVTTPGFAARPAWEREKYVRLLGTVAGESAVSLFESWIPAKRWFWQSSDLESAELGLRGLAAAGPIGLERARAHAAARGKRGEIASKVLEASGRDHAEQTLAPTGARPKGSA